MELKPGEYVGQDGATYSVTHIYAKWRDGDGYHGTQAVRPTDPDFPAALAALQALWEDQGNPWIPIGNMYRIRQNGTDLQYQNASDHPWMELPNEHSIALAYRACMAAYGLERGEG